MTEQDISIPENDPGTTGKYPEIKPLIGKKDKEYKEPLISEEEAQMLLIDATEELCGAVQTPGGLTPSGDGGWLCHLKLKKLTDTFDRDQGTRKVLLNFHIPAGIDKEGLYKLIMRKTKIPAMNA